MAKICKGCGVPVVGRWKNARYCTPECQLQAHREQTLAMYYRRRAYHVNAPRDCRLPSCQKSFIPDPGNQRYCSDECRRAAVLRNDFVRVLSKHSA